MARPLAERQRGTYRVVLTPQGDTCECEDFRSPQTSLASTSTPPAGPRARPRRQGARRSTWTPCRSGRPTRSAGPRTTWRRTRRNIAFRSYWPTCAVGIEEPPPVPHKRGRKPHLLRDCVFSAALKVYSTFSTRRFQCDLTDAHGEGYLTADVPSMKICEFLQNDALTPILKRLIVAASLPLRTVETVFAPDSTGFSVPKFVRWYDEKYGRAALRQGLGEGARHLRREDEHRNRRRNRRQDGGRLAHVQAAGGDDGRKLHGQGSPGRQGVPVARQPRPGREAGRRPPTFRSRATVSRANRDSLWHKHVPLSSSTDREEFLPHYHQRSNAESTFSAVKRKFGDAVRSKHETAMKNEVLCKFLCHNICCVIMEQCVLGIDAEFWPEEVRRGRTPGRTYCGSRPGDSLADPATFL